MNENQLIDDYKYLVNKQLSYFYVKNTNDREDLKQDGMIGLLQAGRKWRKELGKFPTFASKCIRNEIIKGLRRTINKDIIFKRLDKTTKDHSLFWVELSDILKQVDMDILLLKYHGYTLKEIGAKYNRGRNWASMKLYKIQNVLEDYYYV